MRLNSIKYMHDLPRILMITAYEQRGRDIFLGKLILHIKKEIKLIQLRIKELDIPEYVSLAKDSIKIGNELNAKIILNTDITIANQLNADGVNLTSNILMSTNQRPLSSKKIVSAACHNLDQLIHAKQIGVDFVTLSPVAHTNTHPEATPLGWRYFSELCKKSDLPIYALGGLREEDLDLARSYGAYGLAAISALWDKQY